MPDYEKAEFRMVIQRKDDWRGRDLFKTVFMALALLVAPLALAGAALVIRPDLEFTTWYGLAAMVLGAVWLVIREERRERCPDGGGGGPPGR